MKRESLLVEEASNAEGGIGVRVLTVLRWHVHVRGHVVTSVGVVVHWGRRWLLWSNLELDDDLLLASHVPWHQDLSRLSKGRDVLWPDEEVVRQIDFLA